MNKMDEEIDIEKIETFLQNLKNEKPISESIASNSAENNRECTDQSSIVSSSIERQGKCKLGTPAATGTKEKQKCLQMSLKYNKECFSILSSLESSLSILLEECLKEQKIIREDIDAIECHRVGDSKYGRNVPIRKTCSSPYFKEQDCFPCQYNEDFLRRKNSGYLDPWYVIKTLPWNDTQKRTLEKSIKEINMQNEKSVACSAKNCSVSNRIDEKCTPEQQNAPVTFNEEKYDWIKISVVCLNGDRGPLECRAMWYNYLHPKINKMRWTEKESQNLKILVEKNNYEDWESISINLGTCRSAYQCIGHFKIRLADFSKIKWSARDVLFVEKLVKMFRVSHFTPWRKLSWLMDGRSTAEVYRKWKAHYGDIKKGKYSLEEDLLLVVALKQFGEDWNQISQYLPQRDNIQVRSRVMVLKGRALSGPWTQSEDILLEELVQKYGFGNWAKISTHFLSRSNIQVRARYHVISKQKNKQTSDVATTIRAHTPRPSKDGRSLDGLWIAAQKIVQKKLNIDPEDTNSEINMIYELSQILKPHKKRGRKKGSKNFPLLHEEFHNYFHVAYRQRGGRGKDTYVELPTLVYQTLLTLHLLNAKIVLSSQNKLIDEDCTLLDMDKSLIMFLVDRKKSVLENCKFISFENTSECLDFSSSSASAEHSLKSICSEKQCEEWYPLCPPSGATLIGLRAMLLNRKNVREQSKGLTVQNTNSTQTFHRTDKYKAAKTLWNKRLEMMYTWAAVLSKMYPQGQFIINSTNNDVSSKEPKTKSTRKRRKRHYKTLRKISKRCHSGIDSNVQGEDSNLTSPPKQKRTYVKSGKFTAKAQVCGSIRRHTRNTKTDSENMCIN